MADITVLPKEISELIAAGEVVERPASVIKELVENSIDAGSTAITVEIEHGGVTYMRVTDNGCGIARDQIKTAFLRHATSKIKSANDLDAILTLGFRGEALASISAVSKVEIMSAVSGENGVCYELHGGEEVSFEEIGCPKGTTIIVRDLFYNVPARMKFLKKDVTEGNTVASIMDRIALSHPEVAVKLIRDGKTVLNTVGDGKLKSAVYSVLGRDFSLSLIPVQYEEDALKLTGFVCLPTRCRPNRNGQFFFLNGRFIKSGTMAAALDRAYQNSAMVGKFPACVLNLSIPAGTVDVNVHPTKTEVRFTDERRVFDTVYRGVKQAIVLGDRRPELNLSTKKPTNIFAPTEEFKQAKMNLEMNNGQKTTQKEFNLKEKIVAESTKPKIKLSNLEDVPLILNDSSSFNEKENLTEIFGKNPPPIYEVTLESSKNASRPSFLDIKVEEKSKSVELDNITQKPDSKIPLSKDKEIEADINPDIDPLKIKYIGEAFDTYIIVSYENSLYLIDKHAAHERINFEKLKKGLEIQSQLLLTPVSVTLMAEEFDAIISNTKTLLNVGFTVEDFGGNTVIVRSVPSILEGEDITSLISEIAETLRITGEPLPKKIDDILHSISCKSAIKAGNITSKEELLSLAKKVLTSKSLMYCPHGRPIAFELKRSQIEKQFGRLG
ncbi:MAG: DNA mismatch repair endonuclease MutL [Acutalibacteraceae bacterium]|nr:DNA mismatch repair endonuclease MutL [Acutalibacteraceae bacterium]